jgi:hypothetical protein
LFLQCWLHARSCARCQHAQNSSLLQDVKQCS